MTPSTVYITLTLIGIALLIGYAHGWCRGRKCLLRDQLEGRVRNHIAK